MALPFGLRFSNFLKPRQASNEEIEQAIRNKFNEAFFIGSTGSYAVDDDNFTKKYIEYAYNVNPDVYSVVNQITNKFTSIPYIIKDVNDDNAMKRLKSLNDATNYDYSLSQEVKSIQLKDLAYSDDYMALPLDRPNASQTWDEFWTLSDVFLQTTGNVYWYIQAPEDGMNAGVPTSIYVMPSHLMEIVVKPNVSMVGDESPIDYYMLKETASYIEFDEDEIIHIKYPNPNYDDNGSHLYGQSPLRAVYKNIIATNKGLDLEVNTLKSGGAFGFIHAKDGQTPLLAEQAQGIKERLKQMNKSTEDLGRIAGASAALGFTRISLTPEELQPFEYFKFNLKNVCNALGWDSKLMNDDDGAKYDNMKIAEKRVVTGKIVPDIRLFEQSFNKFIQRFKGYENSCIDWLVKELPEMQQDYKTMSDWVVNLTNSGYITRNQGLKILGMDCGDDPNLDLYTVKDDIITLEDALLPQDLTVIRE